MSARVTGMVFDRYPASGGELLLALALADHAHDNGTHIFPSVAYLAKKTRQSERSVQYQLRRMEASTWLILVNSGLGGRRRGVDDGGVTREYRINPEWLKGADIAPFGKSSVEHSRNDADSTGAHLKGADSAPFKEASKGAKSGSQGCKNSVERVQKVPSKGATAVAPEPRATKSNQEQHSLRDAADMAAPGQLTEREVRAELDGFGPLPDRVDPQLLAGFCRHRRVLRRPLSVQGWMQVRAALANLTAAGHDPNESLRQTMAAGLSLPVTPVASPNAGGPHASAKPGSADHVDQLHQQFLDRKRGAFGGQPTVGAGVIDADFTVVG